MDLYLFEHLLNALIGFPFVEDKVKDKKLLEFFGNKTITKKI
tara:strand:- start:262 stop:387 length:126 start_codon:yes stop_codon:yes gene_type:complete